MPTTSCVVSSATCAPWRGISHLSRVPSRLQLPPPAFHHRLSRGLRPGATPAALPYPILRRVSRPRGAARGQSRGRATSPPAVAPLASRRRARCELRRIAAVIALVQQEWNVFGALSACPKLHVELLEHMCPDIRLGSLFTHALTLHCPRRTAPGCHRGRRKTRCGHGPTGP